jgi:hypothetical protein
VSTHRYVAILHDTSHSETYFVPIDVFEPEDCEDMDPLAQAMADQIAVATDRIVIDVLTPDQLVEIATSCDSGSPSYAQANGEIFNTDDGSVVS